MKLVLGSRNAHKLRELSALLEPHDVASLPPDVELPPESGASFAEHALAKARATAEATGQPALGEDSGLAVDALGGAPGIHSARYAGDGASDDKNLAKLAGEMHSVGDRTARYVCALAFVEPGGDEHLFEAMCEGRLAHEPEGSGGFGYDPLFIPDDGPDPSLTMAALPAEKKNAISHRGKAARLLLEWLSSRA